MHEIPSEVISSEPSVRMFTAPNPGPMTLSGTHTFFIGQDPCYILDPGPDLPAYQDALAEELRRDSRRPVAILLSHAHPDHAPGATRLRTDLKVPVWASPLMPPDRRRILGVDSLYEADQSFPLGNDTLHVISSPGHTADHAAFWLEGARILFAGDTILGHGTTLVAPPEGDMRAYMATLERMRALDPRIIAPGHGPLILDPSARIEEYVRHRVERERQTLLALQDGPASLTDLVGRIYADVDSSLHTMAAGSLQAQLLKLEAEGKVRRSGDRYERVPGDNTGQSGRPQQNVIAT
jgi:glyoxylase-like metal-dependent hydrolase (beta-lactamase superfamily II)